MQGCSYQSLRQDSEHCTVTSILPPGAVQVSSGPWSTPPALELPPQCYTSLQKAPLNSPANPGSRRSLRACALVPWTHARARARAPLSIKFSCAGSGSGGSPWRRRQRARCSGDGCWACSLAGPGWPRFWAGSPTAWVGAGSAGAGGESARGEVGPAGGRAPRRLPACWRPSRGPPWACTVQEPPGARSGLQRGPRGEGWCSLALRGNLAGVNQPCGDRVRAALHTSCSRHFSILTQSALRPVKRKLSEPFLRVFKGPVSGKVLKWVV